LTPDDITEEMYAACHADSSATSRAFRSIIRKNAEATMRCTFKIELTELPPEVSERIVAEVLRRLKLS
jgi:hypothetical protein